MTYGDFFKGKKVAVVGLGPRGEMRHDIKFLLKQGVAVTVYDMRGLSALRRIIADLKAAGLKEYLLGGVPGEALAAHDLIILSPDLPRSAEFLKESRNLAIPIEYPDILSLKLAPPVTIVGVMGSCGKKAIISMLADSIKRSFRATGMPAPFIIDCEYSNGSLAILSRIKKDGLVIVRMPDYSLAEYARARLSPSVAIIAVAPSTPDPFSTMSKTLAYQTYNSFIITTDEIADMIHNSDEYRNKAKIVRTRAGRFPREWGISFRGEHEREDAALVLETASLFKIDENFVRAAALDYTGKKSPGGIIFIKKVKGVAFYDDSSSERPEATLAALRALSSSPLGNPGADTILIMGGAETGADYDLLLQNISQYTKVLVLVPGSGTLGLRKRLGAIENLKCLSAPSVEVAVKLARAEAKAGDRILYSPAFAAAGYDPSRAARGERFVKAVRGLW
jgi:UDP-N-acetylmuramoylalanine-D-glutamate ligase